jgi:hypothetical protein
MQIRGRVLNGWPTAHRPRPMPSLEALRPKSAAPQDEVKTRSPGERSEPGSDSCRRRPGVIPGSAG